MLAVAVGAWEARRPATTTEENPLANATFSRVTNWEGTEEHAEISPDGRFVAFLADRAGQLDVWVSQVGTGTFDNLTLDLDAAADARESPAQPRVFGRRIRDLVQSQGQSRAEKVLMPLTGGTPSSHSWAQARPLHPGRQTTPDLVYIGSSEAGDPLSIADRTGADPRPIRVR